MPNQPEVILSYGQGDSEVRTFRVEKEDIIIGRAAECDIQLDDPRVSRFHATFRVTADGMWLLDMESKNGTLIGEQPIPPNRRIALQPEQSFRVGPFTFRALVDHGRDAAATATDLRPRGVKVYDVEALRQAEFPHMLDWINLDNAAGAGTPVRTLNKMKQVLDERIASPRWHIGRYPLELLGGFVGAAAALINAESPGEIVFVEGCSAGLNLVAQSLELRRDDNIIFCDLEFPANVYPWMSLQRDGVLIRQVPSTDGGLSLDAVRRATDANTRVVAASAVQFFTGHRTDLSAIGEFCRERDILFVVDAIQAVGHMRIDVREMNIDVLVTGAHKSLMTAPGNGFLYVRNAVSERLKPRTVGSYSTTSWLNFLKYDLTPQAGAGRFLISTPNVEGIAGMTESIGLIRELTPEAIDRHTTALAARALEMARERGYELTTKPGQHGPIATFRSKKDKDQSAAQVQKLEDQGITLARRLDREDATHIRMSFHCYNTEQEMIRAFEALDKLE